MGLLKSEASSRAQKGMKNVSSHMTSRITVTLFRKAIFDCRARGEADDDEHNKRSKHAGIISQHKEAAHCCESNVFGLMGQFVGNNRGPPILIYDIAQLINDIAIGFT